jgi:transposase
MKYYIGLDAHTASSTGVVVNEKGDVLLRQTFKTTESNLLGFIKRIPSPKHLTFEECHLAQWLYVLLKEQVDGLIVCNPVFVAKKPGAKTDDRDALHLAQELRTGHLVPVYHDESHWIELRVLVSGYLALIDGIVRAKNRLKAVFRAEAVPTSDADFYVTARERSKELSHENARFVAESLFWQIETLEKRKAEYREAFKRNIKRYRPIKNLTSIPGIDVVRANIIAAIVCMPNRFKNKHKFWSYCMLVRHIQESGGRIYGNKRAHGRSELKEAFLGAAQNVLMMEGSLRDYYDQLRAKGNAHPEAKLGLARKIAAITLSVLKNNYTFDDLFEARKNYRGTLRKKLNEAV